MLWLPTERAELGQPGRGMLVSFLSAPGRTTSGCHANLPGANLVFFDDAG